MRGMTGNAIALLERFVGMNQFGILTGHLLPMAITTHILHGSPQLGWVGPLQIVAHATGTVAKRLMHKIEAIDGRRPQSYRGSDGRRGGGNEWGWCGTGNRLRTPAGAQQDKREHN